MTLVPAQVRMWLLAVPGQAGRAVLGHQASSLITMLFANTAKIQSNLFTVTQIKHISCITPHSHKGAGSNIQAVITTPATDGSTFRQVRKPEPIRYIGHAYLIQTQSGSQIMSETHGIPVGSPVARRQVSCGSLHACVKYNSPPFAS